MWYTPEDLFNELSEVTGRKVADFDGRDIARGAHPPPPLKELIDEEYADVELQFGNVSMNGCRRSDRMVEPDLAGIQKMLSLINNLENPDEEKVTAKPNTRHTLVISKLDPNVEEFVPKLLKNRITKDDKENISKEANGDAFNKKSIAEKSNACNGDTFNKENIVEKANGDAFNKKSIAEKSNACNGDTFNKENIVEKANGNAFNKENIVEKANGDAFNKENICAKASGDTFNKKSIAEKANACNGDTFNKENICEKANGDTFNKENICEKANGAIVGSVIETKTAAPIPASNNDMLLKDSEKSRNLGQASEKAKIVATLKSKIIETSKSSSFEHRRERNVAIAALLRLNTKPATPVPATPASHSPTAPPREVTSSPKPVLFTPQYFAVPPANFKETEDTVEVTSNEAVTTAIHETVEINDVHVAKEATEAPDNTLAVDIDTPEPEEIKQSILKVENWLHSPDKPHAKPKKAVKPILHTGPVTFRKKIISSVAPSTVETKLNTEQKTASHWKPYVPTERASELNNRFAEYRKKKEAEKLASMNVFEKLEVELKARDEAARKKLLEKQNEHHPSTSGC